MSVAPKRPKGPPLNAMRAFEAAARHVSFVAAAEELNVTPGAISQHIKTLEAWSGMPLFRRNAQGVQLTKAGMALVPEFTVAFDGLAEATRALRNLTPKADFQIAALPSIAQLWLPKRLSQARQAFPEISFSVTAMETPPSLARELFDLALFFTDTEDTADCIRLCPDHIVPVCAPSLQNQYTPETLLTQAPRLHDQTWAHDWSDWSEAAEVAIEDVQTGPQFSLYSLAVEEAKAGAGLLIGHLALIEDQLSGGSLVKAHDAVQTTAQSLCLHLPEKSQRRPETQKVVDLFKNA